MELLKKEGFIEQKVDSKELLKVVSLIKDRLRKLADFSGLSEYFFRQPKYQKELLIFKKSTKEQTFGYKRAEKNLQGP